MMNKDESKCASKFDFIDLKIKDLPLLHSWYQEQNIIKWYAKNKLWSIEDINNWYLPRLQGKQNIPSFIVHYQNQPIGFIQYYWLSEFSPDGMELGQQHKLFEKYKPNEIGGIDMYIVNKAKELFGKGVGTAILSEFIKKPDLRGFKVLVLDPAENNIAAIKCYKKCGFKYFSTEYQDNGNIVYLMIKKSLATSRL